MEAHAITGRSVLCPPQPQALRETPLLSEESYPSSGAQDVMELAGASGPRLLPWVSAVVKRVDLEARRIEVDWGADW